MEDSSEKKMAKHMFHQREEKFVHASFDREMACYDSVCSGDLEMVKVLATPLCSEGYGILSKNPLRNIQYHFVISAAMLSRFCIKGGMSPDEAYHLSDFYIMQADECKTVEEVHKIHAQMLEGYTKKMRSLRNSSIYSKQIVMAMDYVSDHLHGRIMLEDAAAYLQISVSYLSRLFRTETGMTFTDYVNQKKIETAASLLRFSDYTDLEISSLLAYSSQSYFIKMFKKYMGVTPKIYKKQYHVEIGDASSY